MVILALNSFCLEISSCLIQSSVEITAAAMFLTVCSGIVLQTGINTPKWSDGVHEMCGAIVFPPSLPKQSPKSGSSTGFCGLECPRVQSSPHKCILPQVCLCVCVFCWVFPHWRIFAPFCDNRGRERLFFPGDSWTVGAHGWLHRGGFQGCQRPGVCWEGGTNW